MRRTACAWVLCVPAPVLAAQEVPVFSSGVEVVRVDVSVLRDGRRIDGLRAGDFEVEDNGVRQTVQIVGDPLAAAAGVVKPVDIVLALDVSDSVRGEQLSQLKAAAHAFVDLLHPDDSFSLLTFSSRVRLAVSPADSRARAHDMIEATEAQLTTSLHDAAFAAVVTADARRGRPLALILSDGEDHGSWLKPEQVLRAAERSDLVAHVLFTRHTGSQPTFLLDLAATTGGEAWRADYGQLRDALSRALEEFRSRYTLSYERRGVSRAGWHELEVRVRRPGVKVRARTGYVDVEDRGEDRP
ncbi:MAG: VWA domain-containing protein [Solirubrobacterales bacterium]|jgi:VWFA-related protein